MAASLARRRASSGPLGGAVFFFPTASFSFWVRSAPAAALLELPAAPARTRRVAPDVPRPPARRGRPAGCGPWPWDEPWPRGRPPAGLGVLDGLARADLQAGADDERGGLAL